MIIKYFNMTVSESLLQIADLTKQNLQILNVLNDSFYTKRNHLTTTVGEKSYTIPSYIALENKVNHLQDAFNNLVHSAECGEAWFNFDGNSREIQVRNYQYAPNPIVLTPRNNFESEDKYMFKDMLTPQPYLDFDLSNLSDDITKVVVKKVIPYRTALQQIILNNIDGMLNDDATAVFDWSLMVRCLGATYNGTEFVSGNDYLEYDSVYELPVRTCTKSGNYVIEKVLEVNINEDLNEVIRVKICDATPLTTLGFDGIEVENLKAGDVLITYDGSAKMKITNIIPAAMELTLEVMSGEYVNPIGAGVPTIPQAKTIFDVVTDYSKLRYYSQPTDARKLHIPLEEDQYVFIAVAPLNPRLNTQASWGTGLMVNTDNLTMVKGEDEIGFRSYYNDNVSNIGDALIEFANVMFPSITKYSVDEFQQMMEPPVLSQDTLNVFQINKHLNDSESVQTIRSLYSQKKQYQTSLTDIQSRIQSLNDELSQISFDDMTGTRSAYTSQIADLKEQQNQISSSITKITEQIAQAANDALIPLEEGKFRIRGYVDVDKFVEKFRDWNLIDGLDADAIAQLQTSNIKKMRNSIIGTQTRYRYKNPDIPQSNVQVINDFLFTEWSIYEPPIRERSMSYNDGKYNVRFEDTVADGEFNSGANINKFNQIDIPINQGEVVEVQTRIVWGFGYPFVTVATDWSDPIEVEFPAELVKDVQVTTIIEENNSDIEANRFTNILNEKGIIKHVDDNIQDQDITYFHRPEDISSGFYTQERRIIPLRDKLMEMHNNIVSIQDTLQGTTSEALTVSFIIDGVNNILSPDINNIVQLPAFNTIKDLGDGIPTGSSYKTGGVVYTTGLISLTNTTEHSLRIFSMFPGARDLAIADLVHTKFNKADFEYDKPQTIMFGTPLPTPLIAVLTNDNGNSDEEEDQNEGGGGATGDGSTNPGNQGGNSTISLFFTPHEDVLSYDIYIDGQSWWQARTSDDKKWWFSNRNKHVQVQEGSNIKYVVTGTKSGNTNIVKEFVANTSFEDSTPGGNVGMAGKTIYVTADSTLGKFSDKVTITVNKGDNVISVGNAIWSVDGLGEFDNNPSIRTCSFETYKGQLCTVWCSGGGKPYRPCEPEVFFANGDKTVQMTVEYDETYSPSVREGGDYLVTVIADETISQYTLHDRFSPEYPHPQTTTGVQNCTGGTHSTHTYGGYSILVDNIRKADGTKLDFDVSEVVHGDMTIYLTSTGYRVADGDDSGNTGSGDNNNGGDNQGGNNGDNTDPGNQSGSTGGNNQGDNNNSGNTGGNTGNNGSGNNDQSGDNNGGNTGGEVKPDLGYEGVDILIITPSGKLDDKTNPLAHPQTANQIITYRTKNPYDDSNLDNMNCYTNWETGEYGLKVYPVSVSQYSMCMTTDATNASIIMAPGESYTFPVGIEYVCDALDNSSNAFSFRMGFNVRNSLYSDPLYYQVELSAKYNATTADLLNSAKQSINNLTNYNTTVR